MKVIAIIPARGGSKGIPMKNIKLFREKPLIAWSIELAKQCNIINRIIVSTDDEDIANVSREYGAEVIDRPKEISQDLSTDYECMEHCLEYIGYENADIIIQLRPTYPTRKLVHLDNCIKMYIENMNDYDSLRTIIEYNKSPYKMYNIKNNILVPLFQEVNGIKEPYNNCRQILPKTYLHNGYIDVFKAKIIKNKQSITGDNILPYLMNKTEYHDIDTEHDWKDAEGPI